MTTIPPEPPGPPSDGDDNRPPAPPSAPGDGGYAPPQQPQQPPAPDWQQQAAPPGYQQPPPGYGAPQGYGQPAPAYGMAPYDPQAKSKLAAGLLGIFLGGFGVHRFYLGFTKIGIIQIVVTIFTCGIGSLWGFVEGILYLVGSNGYTTDATGRPLRD
jgi:TM2 domain-containing membrane protein YozV